jgi:hypothetical protein
VDALNRWRIFIFFCFIFYLATDLSYAGAVLYRIQQMKAQKEQQAQMTQEQYQAYQQQQQQAQGQQAPLAPPTYQQTVDQRNQAIAQAILDSHNQSVSSENVPFGNNAEIAQTQQKQVVPQAIRDAHNQVVPNEGTGYIDVVDLSEVWKKLDTKSTVWTLLIDDKDKVMTVSEYIDRFHKQGVKINEPPAHYVEMIDQIVTQNPDMLNRPFGELVQIVAIVDYDFDNGMSKDDLARKVLGEEGFEANKKRFTQQAQGATAGQ